MPLDPKRQLHLLDSHGTCLGTVVISRIEGDQIFAKFTAAPEFDAVRKSFEEFEEAVNDQLFREVDRLSQQIATFGLRIASSNGNDSVALDDVQIMNEVDLSCRVPHLGLIQDKPATAQAG